MGPHAHTFDGRWPFAEPENTLAICCVHILERSRPILRVSHDHDGDWQFLCGEPHETSEGRVICMGCALEIDGTLVAVATLEVGWGADRESLEGTWVREANPPPDPDDDSVDDA